MIVKYAMGGIAGVGLFGAVSLFRLANNGGPIYLIAAGAVLLIMMFALTVIYLTIGQPVEIGTARVTQDRGERRIALESNHAQIPHTSVRANGRQVEQFG